jgi:hypothetical protein
MSLSHLPRLLAVIVLLLSLTMEWTQASAITSSQIKVTPGVEGFTLEWQAPEPQLSKEPDGTIKVNIEGFSQLNEPGLPQLPFSTRLIAIPPGTNPELEIVQVNVRVIPLGAPVSTAPTPEGVERAVDGSIIGGALRPSENTRQFSPQTLELERLGRVREFELARLVFYPVRPQGENLHFTSSLHATVRFSKEGSLPKARTLSGTAARPISSILESMVINPGHLQPHPIEQATPEAALRTNQVEDLRVVVEVKQRGLTELTHAMLTAAGIPVSEIDPGRLHLSRAGVEIAFQWDGDADSQFESGERVLFYADPRFSRWTSSDMYFLWQGHAPGLLMDSRSADPSGLPSGVPRVETVAEQNKIYTPECYCAPIPAGRDGDRWIWDRLQIPDRASASYAIDLPDIDTSQAANLKLWLIGFTDLFASPDHNVQVAFNEFPIGDVEWEGKQAVEAAFSIPASSLKTGNNTVTISLPGLPDVNVEGVWLDAFYLAYARADQFGSDTILFRADTGPRAYSFKLNSSINLRAYDVSQPDQPVKLEELAVGQDNTVALGYGGQNGEARFWATNEAGILAPVSLRPASDLNTAAPFSGVDYLIISPPAFVPALDDLIALRQTQGFTVAVEDAQAIFDSFGGGRPEPEAIRTFLAHAYANWNPPPTYILLMGDGTSDPKGYLDNSSATFIPPYLADVDPWAGETASDNRYVAVDGDDNLPDILIGRLPVNSLAEAQTVVEKIVQYETNPTEGNWTARTHFVADNADPAGNFAALSDSLIADYIMPPRQANRLYYRPSSNSAVDVQQDLLQSWSSGSSLIMFTGHASIHQWGAEKFFHLDDVAALNNASRLPVILEMTCFTGSFQSPGFPTLDEALLRHPGGGAVAAWGPTGLGVATGHAPLAEGFLGSLLEENQVDLGTAILAGKINLANQHPYYGDLIDTFTLLGDPATRLTSPSASYPHYLPIVEN